MLMGIIIVPINGLKFYEILWGLHKKINKEIM